MGRRVQQSAKSLMPVRIDTPNLLRQLRQKKFLSQKSLASQIGVSSTVISAWETGNTIPPPEVLPQLAEALQVPLDVIVQATSTQSSAKRVNVTKRLAFGRQLADWRYSARLTQTALAQTLGVKQHTVAGWEHGLNWPSVPLPDLEKALRLSRGTISSFVETLDATPIRNEPVDLEVLREKINMLTHLFRTATQLINEIQSHLAGLEETGSSD